MMYFFYIGFLERKKLCYFCYEIILDVNFNLSMMNTLLITLLSIITNNIISSNNWKSCLNPVKCMKSIFKKCLNFHKKRIPKPHVYQFIQLSNLTLPQFWQIKGKTITTLERKNKNELDKMQKKNRIIIKSLNFVF